MAHVSETSRPVHRAAGAPNARAIRLSGCLLLLLGFSSRRCFRRGDQAIAEGLGAEPSPRVAECFARSVYLRDLSCSERLSDAGCGDRINDLDRMAAAHGAAGSVAKNLGGRAFSTARRERSPQAVAANRPTVTLAARRFSRSKRRNRLLQVMQGCCAGVRIPNRL
jgi:hypothetical protein